MKQLKVDETLYIFTFLETPAPVKWSCKRARRHDGSPFLMPAAAAREANVH